MAKKKVIFRPGDKISMVNALKNNIKFRKMLGRNIRTPNFEETNVANSTLYFIIS